MSLERSHPHLGEVVMATEVISSGLSAHRVRVIILLLAGSVGLMMTGFGIIMPIFAKRLGEFGSGVGALALMTMSFALTQFLAAPFMGSLADRFGRVPVILVALSGFTAANIGFLVAPSTEVFLAVRALEGGFTAGLMPAALGIVADIVPEEKRGQWVGIVMGSMGAGFIFGPVVGGVLYEAWGFEAPFVVSALLGFVALISTVILVPETRTREVRRRDDLRQRWASAFAPAQQGSVWASLPRPLRVFGTLLLIDFTLAFTFGFVEPQMVFYFYDDLGWTPIQFGMVVGAYGLAMVGGQAALGGMSDRFGRKPVIVMGIVLFATFYFALAIVVWFPLTFAVAFVAGLGEALIMPAESAFYMDITSERHQSRVMGIRSSSHSLGAVVGPLVLIGAAVLATPRSVFISAALTTLAVGVLALVILREPRRAGKVVSDIQRESSERRALAAQAALRGVVVNARAARGGTSGPA